MKKIFVICVCVLLIATIFGASFSVLAAKGGGGGGKPPKEDPDPTPAEPAIAYRGKVGDNSGLCVMNADGSHQTHIPLPDGFGGIYGHCWSPDGTKIAFTAGLLNDSVMRLWSIDITVDAEENVHGSNVQQLVSEKIATNYLAWSPNGDMIAFLREHYGVNGAYYSIWLYHVTDGTTEKIFTDPDQISIAGDLLYLTWDPIGTKLAFVKDTRRIDSIMYPPEIRTIDISTKTVETVYSFPDNISPGFYYCGLDWANNDDKIAFNLMTWGNYHIAIYDISESSTTTLSATALSGTLSWSSDDSKIAYTYFDQGAKGKKPKEYINTIDVFTEETVTLAVGSMADWCIA